MKNIRIGQKEIIHFIGIGGIGMSGLAQVMKNMGLTIQTEVIIIKIKAQLIAQKQVSEFSKGHSKKNIRNATIIVRSSAIKNNNIEILEAKKENSNLFKS